MGEKSKEELKKTIKRELNQTLLKVTAKKAFADSYQLRMLQENQINSLLEVRGYDMDGESVYEYNVSGKTTLNYRYEKKKIDAKEMKRILEAVAGTVEELANYLLEPNSLLIDPEYIYVENGTYFFCYVPGWEEDIGRAFHRLMDCFVQWTDYQDTVSVKLAFMLHKETMEPNYSLKKIQEMLGGILQEHTDGNYAEQRDMGEYDLLRENESGRYPMPEEEFLSVGTYEYEEGDWITRQELGAKMLRDSENMWMPMKRFLQKHKRPKWGDWDGIYIDEDEL